MSFTELLSATIIYALMILSPLPYGSVEELWRFLIISAIALTGILTAMKFLLNKNSEIILHKSYTIFFAIIIAVLISALFSPRQYASLRSWIFFAGTALIPFVIINNFDTGEKLKRLIFVLLFSGLFFSIYGLTKIVLYSLTPGEHFRLTFTSTFYNHNHFAGFIECILPFAISRVLFYRKERAHKSFIYILLSAILFATLLLTFSRGGIISFMIAFLVVILLYLNNLKIFIPTLLTTSIILYLTFSLKSVLIKIFAFEQIILSGQARMSLSKSGLLSILDRPLIGWGPGNFEIAYLKHRDSIDGIVNYAHNDYIQAFAELGIPVTLVFLTILIWTLFSGIKEIKSRHNPFYYYLGSSATLSIISISIHEFVDFNLRIPAVAIYFTIILSIFILSTFAERKSSSNNELIEKSVSREFKIKLFFPALLSIILLICSAKIFYNELLFKRADNLYRYGEIEIQDEDLEAIENSFFKSAKYYNLHCRILNTRAGIENSQKLFERALEKCLYATRLDNFNSFYALDTAEIYKKLGEIEKSLYYFRTASEIDPENAYLNSILIKELMGVNKLDEARDLSFKFVNKHPEKTIEILTILKDDKNLLKSFVSFISKDKKDINEDILNFLHINNMNEEYLESFLNLYSNNFNFSKQKFYNIAANYLIKTRMFDEAESILKSGIKLYPYEPEGYLDLMNLLFFFKKYEELLKLTDEVERKVNTTDVYYYRALVYLDKGEPLLALNNAKLCVGRNVSNNRYRYLLYDIYLKMGMEYEAMQALGDPRTFTSNDVHLIYLRASLFEKWDKKEEAIQEYKKILSFQPENQNAIKKIIELEEKTNEGK